MSTKKKANDRPDIQWNATWLLLEDCNKDVMNLWCRKETSKTFLCTWCLSSNSFTRQGLHALKQDSGTQCHQKRHDDVMDKTSKRIGGISSASTSSASSSSSGSSSQEEEGFFKPAAMGVKQSLADRTTNAEVLWMLKVCASDYSLNSCEDITKLFHNMFDCDVTQNKDFSLGRNKASYCISDGLSPVMLSSLCQDVDSDTGFTILFDETTTAQNKKQMDLLLRYWSEQADEVLTSYLTSLKFGRCEHDELRDKFIDLINDPQFKDLPWNKFFNLSSDGPNINLALYRVLNDSLKKTGHLGLLPFINCCLHTVHNGFHKGILVFGQDCEQLAYDLHAWFKQAPCKEEDYRGLSDDSTMENESLFLRHLSTRWLTLVPSLERIKKRWDDARNYFLNYVKNKKEYARTLPKNKKFARIEEALNNEVKLMLQMSFLTSIAPLFTDFLLIFQGEGPLIHVLYHELENMVSKLLSRFLKPEVVADKKGEDLLEIVVEDANNQLPLEKINVGPEVQKYLKKCNKQQREEYLKEMQNAFCKISNHLMEKLPLCSQFLKDMVCLHPLKRASTSSSPISRIAQHMPHIIPREKVASLKDEWELLKNDDDVVEDWFLTKDGHFKRLDHYWREIFKLKTLSGQPRYPLLTKVVKSCCSLQNGNAAVERSLSDNKNTLTKERTSLGDETLKGLRRGKEFCRRNGGAHQVVVSRNMRDAVRSASSAYRERVREEQKAAAALAAKKAAEEEEQKKHDELVAQSEQKKGNLQKKEDQLAADEAEVDKNLAIANGLLMEGTARLSAAVKSNNMSEIQAASALVESANKKIKAVNTHRDNLRAVKEKLGKKRKTLMDAIIDATKKKKK